MGKECLAGCMKLCHYGARGDDLPQGFCGVVVLQGKRDKIPSTGEGKDAVCEYDSARGVTIVVSIKGTRLGGLPSGLAEGGQGIAI